MDAFAIKAGIKTGLKIQYKNALELGADRVARAVAVKQQFPNQNAIIIHLSRINTICALSKEGSFLGGMIFPGIDLSLQALHQAAGRLPPIEFNPSDQLLAQSTVDAMAVGVNYALLAMLTQSKKAILNNYFADDNAIIIGAGEDSQLSKHVGQFDVCIPYLTLQGINTLLLK